MYLYNLCIELKLSIKVILLYIKVTSHSGIFSAAPDDTRCKIQAFRATLSPTFKMRIVFTGTYSSI